MEDQVECVECLLRRSLHFRRERGMKKLFVFLHSFFVFLQILSIILIVQISGIMVIDILVLICLACAALIMMIGPFFQEGTDVESSIRILQIASIPAVLSVLLSWLGAVI